MPVASQSEGFVQMPVCLSVGLSGCQSANDYVQKKKNKKSAIFKDIGSLTTRHIHTQTHTYTH
jgi:hypothetical protein